MARFLFYCVNGNGLGHLTRMLAIARQVRRLAPESDILFLTSSEHTNLLWREGIASVKVPSFEALSNDRRLPVSQLAHALATQVVATFRPHVVVVDAAPAGMFSELLSVLLAVPKRVFVFERFPNYFKQQTYKPTFPR